MEPEKAETSLIAGTDAPETEETELNEGRIESLRTDQEGQTSIPETHTAVDEKLSVEGVQYIHLRGHLPRGSSDHLRPPMEAVSEPGSPWFTKTRPFFRSLELPLSSSGYVASRYGMAGYAPQTEETKLNEDRNESLIKGQEGQTSISKTQMTGDEEGLMFLSAFSPISGYPEKLCRFFERPDLSRTSQQPSTTVQCDPVPLSAHSHESADPHLDYRPSPKKFRVTVPENTATGNPVDLSFKSRRKGRKPVRVLTSTIVSPDCSEHEPVSATHTKKRMIENPFSPAGGMSLVSQVTSRETRPDPSVAGPPHPERSAGILTGSSTGEEQKEEAFTLEQTLFDSSVGSDLSPFNPNLGVQRQFGAILAPSSAVRPTDLSSGFFQRTGECNLVELSLKRGRKGRRPVRMLTSTVDFPDCSLDESAPGTHTKKGTVEDPSSPADAMPLFSQDTTRETRPDPTVAGTPRSESSGGILTGSSTGEEQKEEAFTLEQTLFDSSVGSDLSPFNPNLGVQRQFGAILAPSSAVRPTDLSSGFFQRTGECNLVELSLKRGRKGRRPVRMLTSTVDFPDCSLDESAPGTHTKKGTVEDPSSPADAMPLFSQDTTRETRPDPTVAGTPRSESGAGILTGSSTSDEQKEKAFQTEPSSSAGLAFTTINRANRSPRELFSGSSFEHATKQIKVSCSTASPGDSTDDLSAQPPHDTEIETRKIENPSSSSSSTSSSSTETGGESPLLGLSFDLFSGPLQGSRGRFDISSGYTGYIGSEGKCSFKISTKQMIDSCSMASTLTSDSTEDLSAQPPRTHREIGIIENPSSAANATREPGPEPTAGVPLRPQVLPHGLSEPLFVQSDWEAGNDSDTPMEREASVTAVNSSVTNTLPAHPHLQSFSDSVWRKRDSGCLPRSHSVPSLSQIPSTSNKTFTRANSLPDMFKTSIEEFTPDIDEDDETFRFQSSCPGLYQCSVTGLVFHMDGEGDVVYRIVPWNRRLLARHHKRPAGPRFDIKCLQQSVRQLHLPHCEIRSTGGCDSLSVAHEDDEGIEFIAPHEITETHVIINVTGFSAFGNVKDEDSPPDPVRALVLPFYSPPVDPDVDFFLNVLLLPQNIVLWDVLRTRRKLFGDEFFIQTSPQCKLHPEQEYTLSTFPEDDSILVQPTEAEFVCENYDNYFPTFQVSWETMRKHIKLLLRESKSSHSVWERRVCLSSTGVRRSCGSSALNLPSSVMLFEVRSSFVNGISGPVLKSLLDKLLEKKVMTDSERESVDGIQNHRDKARFVIDTVRKKGDAASSEMIEFLCEMDPFLCEHLRLM